MEFTIADVRDHTAIYLESERNRYIMEALDIDPGYVWDDEHWNDIDHYRINKYNDLFMVAECLCGEVLEIESGLTPEQVVAMIKKLCGSDDIIYIK